MRLPGAISHLYRKPSFLVMAIIKDEYDGQGGSYLLDPKTGKRKLVRQAKPALPQPTEELTDAKTDTQTPTASQD